MQTQSTAVDEQNSTRRTGTFRQSRTERWRQRVPLKLLDLGRTAVSDISALKGAPLQRLSLQHSAVRDISLLKGMPLRTLHLGNTQVSDLAPLAEMELQSLHCPPKAQLTPESLKVIEDLKAQECQIAW